MNIAISGGGIGGLTLAYALQKQGHNITVFERTPELKPVGAGIVIAANAMRAYQSIGLSEAVIEKGLQLSQFRILDQNGRLLSESYSDIMSYRYEARNYSIHRADLHAILLSHLTSGTVRLGQTVTDFAEEWNGVKVTTNNGESNRFDLLVGCDGIHSVIRKKLLIDTDPRYSGYTCWRGIVNGTAINFEGVATETWGNRGRIGMVPLQNNRIYWYACINASKEDEVLRRYSVNDLLNVFKGFHHPVAEVIRNTDPSSIVHNDIIDLRPIRKFSFGRIVLLGDAAHATTPNMGQGACMAIEDAATLANALEHFEDVQEASQWYEQKRIARTTSIVNTSWKLGKVAQLENPLLIKIRNAALRLAPRKTMDRQLEFLYNVSFTVDR